MSGLRHRLSSSWRGGVAALLVMAAVARAADEGNAVGTVQEMGHGKIVLQEKGGLARVFLEGRKDTSYEPTNWRPEQGDQLEIAYIQREQKLVATRVKLVKIGPNNVDPAEMVSPLTVTIVEVGRSGVLATKGKNPTRLRFAFARSTVYEPVGWKPQVGEKVAVTFQAKPNPLTFNISYVLDKIVRQE